MIRKFKEAKEQNLSSVTLWRDGSPTREFLHVEDAAEGIVLAAERYDKPEPVNLGSGQEISIKDLANLIRKLTGYQGAIIWDTTKPNGQPRRLLDVSRAEQEFGFRASSSLTGRLVAQGCVARIFDDLNSGKGEDVGAGGSLTVGDVRDKPAVGTAVSNDVDCVFHLAAQIDVRRAVADPWLDVQVNVGGTINVLNACVEAHVRRFVMSSTGQRILHNCHER